VKTSKSYMIGDGLTDIKAGQMVGCRTILIGTLKCDLCRVMETMVVKPDIITHSLFAASKIIEKEQAEDTIEIKVIEEEVKEELV